MASSVSATAKMRAPMGISRPREAVGIAAAVVVLLVAEDDFGRAGEKGNLAQHVIAAGAVLAHDDLLFRGELAGLAQDVVGNGHLADVVQKSAARDDLDFVRRNAHGASQRDGVGGDALGVAFGFGVLRVERVAQGFKRDVVGVLEIFHGVAQHFGAGADHFFKALVVVLGFFKCLAMIEGALDGVQQAARARRA